MDRLLGPRAALAFLVLGALLISACAALDRRRSAGDAGPQTVPANRTASTSEVATGRPVAWRRGGSVKPPAYSTQVAPTSAAA